MNKNDGEVIQYIEGYAWSVNILGDTICLGEEDKIRTILAKPKEHPSNPTIAQVISVERKFLGQKEKVERQEQQRLKIEKRERHKRALKLGVAKKREKSRK